MEIIRLPCADGCPFKTNCWENFFEGNPECNKTINWAIRIIKQERNTTEVETGPSSNGLKLWNRIKRLGIIDDGELKIY